MWTFYIYICMYVCVYKIQNLRAIINFLPSKHAFGKFNLQWLYIILCELLNVYIYIILSLRAINKWSVWTYVYMIKSHFLITWVLIKWGVMGRLSC